MIETNLGRVVVRAAEEGDWEAVMALIVELAAYEEAQAEVTLTVEQLASDAKHGRFACTLAECEGKVVGMALHHPRYSTWKGTTWYLEDLVVTQSWRGRGVGKALMQAVVKRALDEDAQRLEWQVLDWNEGAIGFYKALGASISSDWLNGRLTRAKLLKT
ncbi:MAG TPA: GNAT family N-acetyltransferase [Flavobacteriales bacterium]|nr:GNAT family N-acetyltransferase [Flavobacteriales bacterium]